MPFGKLPPSLLARPLARAPVIDSRLPEGPGIGIDCAVVDRDALDAAAIPCTIMGDVQTGAPRVLQRIPAGWGHLRWPSRDAVARIFETTEEGPTGGPA